MELEFAGDTGFEEDNRVIEVGINSANRSDKSVYLSIHDDDDANNATGMALTGEKKLKAFLWQVAYDGGLVAEDGELVITKPSERVIPEDGLYTHEHWAGGKSYVVVKDGRLFVPQVDKNGQVYEDGSVLEMTDEYLESNNDLVPVKLGV